MIYTLYEKSPTAPLNLLDMTCIHVIVKLYKCTKKELKPETMIKLPCRTCGKIHSRFGLVTQFDIQVVEGMAVVDEDFHDPLCVWLKNYSTHLYHMTKDERIPQIANQTYAKVQWKKATQTFDKMERNEEGIGCMGK